MSNLNQEEYHEPQPGPHHSDVSQQTKGINKQQRRATYVRLVRGQLSHPQNVQTNGPEMRRNRRKPAPRQTSTYAHDPVLYPDQKLEEADLKNYKCPPKVNSLIHKLNRTCQSQAILINSLQDDKRKLFLAGNKNKLDLRELKTLLSRSDKDEPDGDNVSVTMSWKDARRIFQMLDETDGEDTDIDEDIETVEGLTCLLGGVTLNDPSTPALREVATCRRKQKLRKRQAIEEGANSDLSLRQTRRMITVVQRASGKRISLTAMQVKEELVNGEQVGRDSPSCAETDPF